jgi:hypothetical protein
VQFRWVCLHGYVSGSEDGNRLVSQVLVELVAEQL